VCIVVGDVNRDFIPDLAVTNSGFSTWTVSVLVGHGDGTFETKADYGTGLNPYAVAMGDLNGDAIPDLAVVNKESETVTVLLNISPVDPAAVASLTPAGGASLALRSPNPASGPLVFEIALSRADRVRLGIYDVAGRLVRTVVDEAMAPGAHAVSWDARDNRGRTVPAGAYYCVLRADGEKLEARVVILR